MRIIICVPDIYDHRQLCEVLSQLYVALLDIIILILVYMLSSRGLFLRRHKLDQVSKVLRKVFLNIMWVVFLKGGMGKLLYNLL